MTTIGLAGAGTIGSGLIRDVARPRPGIPAGTPLTARCAELTDDSEIDIVVELLGGVDEAFRVASRALSQGKDKNLLAERGPELFALAAKHKAPVGFEASVCAGIPIIRTLQEALRADRITSLEGIVNGTTNYLLTRMSEERAAHPGRLTGQK